MILGIEKELSIFALAVCTGNLLYLVYCGIYIMRKLFPHKAVWVSIEDIIFWLAAGLFVFGKIEKSSDGMIRWYFLLGMALGGAGTHAIVHYIRKKYIAKTKKTS